MNGKERLAEQSGLRWGVGASLAVLLHGAVLFALLRSGTVAPTSQAPPEAVMLDLPPIATSADVPTPDPTPTSPPDVTPARTSSPDLATTEAPSTVALSPPQEVPPIAPVPPPPQPSAADVAPPVSVPAPSDLSLPSAPTLATMPEPRLRPDLPVPPDPPARSPRPVAPQSRHVPTPVRRASEPTNPVSTEPAASAPTPAQSAPNPVPAPVARAAPNPAGLASWRSALLGRLQAVKQYPSAARANGDEGQALVRFTMNRGGRVMSVSLVRSSGSTLLDEEAVAMIHRAEPLPVPPADMESATLTLTVPIGFSLR